MITDIPYGREYVPARRGTEFLRDGTNRSTGIVRNDDRVDWREAWALFGGDVAYVWHNPLEAAVVQSGLQSQGFEVRAQIIWRKVQGVVGPPRGHYRWAHEAAYYAVRKGKNGHWNGSHTQDTVWDADRPKRNETGHGTQKPVELFRRALENNSSPSDHAYDPFSGSGPLLIAAQATKRIAHCIEIEPSYADVAVRRFANFSGIEPMLAETGETWDQVKARRAAELEVV
jgi:DNA modification methylase